MIARPPAGRAADRRPGFGVRLERRLKALRDGQAEFAQAVDELDRAAARAEAGLPNCARPATRPRDGLHGRIEKAREAKSELERLTTAPSGVRAPAAAPRPSRRRRRFGSSRPRRSPAPARRRPSASPRRSSACGERPSASPEIRAGEPGAAAPPDAQAPSRRAARRGRRRPVRGAAPGPPRPEGFAVSRMPRLLPLVAVAIGGVLAIKAVGASGARHFLRRPRPAPSRSPATSGSRPRQAGPGAAQARSRAPPPTASRHRRRPAAAGRAAPPELVKASRRRSARPPPPSWPRRPACRRPNCRCCRACSARRGQLDQREQAISTPSSR